MNIFRLMISAGSFKFPQQEKKKKGNTKCHAFRRFLSTKGFQHPKNRQKKVSPISGILSACFFFLPVFPI